MISVRPADCLYVAKTLTSRFFSSIINIITLKFCLMVVLIELYPFIIIIIIENVYVALFSN